MKEIFKPEIYIWSNDDFEVMGWHDCPIYGIQFADNITFDIDYIFEWVQHEKDGHYQFWISPALLVFEQGRNLIIDVELDFINGLEIADIHRVFSENNEYEYHIETQEGGDIRLIAAGYKQYIKKDPVLKRDQFLTEEERGGYFTEVKRNI